MPEPDATHHKCPRRPHRFRIQTLRYTERCDASSRLASAEAESPSWVSGSRWLMASQCTVRAGLTQTSTFPPAGVYTGQYSSSSAHVDEYQKHRNTAKCITLYFLCVQKVNPKTLLACPWSYGVCICAVTQQMGKYLETTAALWKYYYVEHTSALDHFISNSSTKLLFTTC